MVASDAWSRSILQSSMAGMQKRMRILSVFLVGSGRAVSLRAADELQARGGRGGEASAVRAR